MSENSARGGTAGGLTNTTTHDWDGGSAYGGAIYSTSNVVVTGSVFWANTVTGSDAVPATGTPSYGFAAQRGTPAGGPGGNAMGADLALGPDAQAQISGTVFDSSTATGGSADVGDAGLDGPDGVNGTDGSCPSDDLAGATAVTEAASGTPGQPGSPGLDGGDGGSAGSAVGVIYGGAAVSVLSSAFLDSQAVTGAAGIGGPPGVGGNGGNGGNGYTCVFGGTTFYYGAGNQGGMGGNDGQAWGAAGSRGDAVATVSTAGPLLFMNTTVSGTQATVTPDVNWDAEMADQSEAVQATAGLPGKPGCNREDDPVVCAPALIFGDGTTAPLFGGEAVVQQPCQREPVRGFGQHLRQHLGPPRVERPFQGRRAAAREHDDSL